MVDDERLLELLGHALAPEPAEPSPERVAAVRLLAERASDPAPRPEASDADIGMAGRLVASRPAGQMFASRPAGQMFASRPAGRGANWSAGQGADWPRRAGWLAAGISVAAAVVVIAMLALPTIGGSGRDGGPAVARLRGALMSGNPVEVARADANLLRRSDTIAAPDRVDAVAAHVEAIQFLRDHPSADAAAQLPPPTDAPRSDLSPVHTTIAPARERGPEKETGPPVVTPTVPVPTTVDIGPPNVTIQAVVARLDGTFGVDFEVSGFTPDASGATGTHTVRFSFDDGQSPTIWGGPSPWAFPVVAGLTFRQVCAHVADAAGVEDPSTGGCHDIV